MAISRKMRLAVYAKCQGHCGYCGMAITLKQMQVDHMMPKAFPSLSAERIDGVLVHGVDKLPNLMPSCRGCNHYKRELSVEGFRQAMITLHERINKIYIVKVGVNFGMLAEALRFDGVFYFEKVTTIKASTVRWAE